MTVGTWIRDSAEALRAFRQRFRRDDRGNIAMIFALSMPVLVLMTVGGVDIHRASTVRVNLQDALDAAALAAARSPYTANTDINRVGLAALRANLAAYPDITLRTGASDTSFALNAENIVVATAKVDVKTLVANIFLPPYGKFMDDYLPVGSHSEVNRSSKDIEVALVLDTTGSMAGQKIIDLRAAANELVDIVVQDQQSPYYSKVAVVPYSMAVNVDTYANGARGALTGSVNISDADWSTGSSKSIDDITRDSPGEVTTDNNHGFDTGDFVWISGVDGMDDINDHAYRVVKISNKKFSLQYEYNGSWYNLNTTSQNGFGKYDDDGHVRECLVSDCSIVITANGHGLSKGQYVRLTNINGMDELNNRTFRVGDVTTNSYSIGVNGDDYDDYSSGGKSWCAQYGCTWFAFNNVYGNLLTHQASTCTTERTGGNRYTDAAPTSRLGINYPSTSNPCLSNTLMPLSSSRNTIKARINSLTASGSTGGHIGVGWGWYAVSPNFASLFGGSGAPAAYNPAEVLKAVVIMTDGEYNSGYCNGVISRDSTTGSGAESLHINCDAPNGHPFDQTLAMCTAMKAQGVIVYTVGFQVVDDARARAVVNNCATSPGNVYLPATGAALSDAFAAIGRDITKLRISK